MGKKKSKKNAPAGCVIPLTPGMSIDGRPVVAMYFDPETILRTVLISLSPDGDYLERVRTHPSLADVKDRGTDKDTWSRLEIAGQWASAPITAAVTGTADTNFKDDDHF